MPNNNGTQTISNEKQVAVLDQYASPLQPDSKPGKQSKIRRERILIISAVMVLVLAGGYFAWNAFHFENTDDAQIDGHVMPLSPRVNGRIKAVYFNEGQLVHAGEAMMTIDPEEYKVAEVLAQVNLSEALSTTASSRPNAKVQTANVEVARRELQLAQAELNFSHTAICSPVTGIVGNRRVEVGQDVNVGQELADVLPLDDVWVTADFKETQLAHMRPGQPVEIHVDAYGRKWKGHVTNMGGGTGLLLDLSPPESAAGSYVKVVQRVPVRIDFDRPPGQEFNAEELLKPGLSVEPKVKVR
ncbi:MAG TPA: HlyD family secretion protein [Candidatus Acidoferrum sp.]|nr:HlyD family secretion protein [Candidatus Acidoferrum sp.]